MERYSSYRGPIEFDYANRRRRRKIGIIVAATLLIGGAGAWGYYEKTKQEGVVREGADGKRYVVPEGAERPVYDSEEDCIADTRERIKQLKEQTGEDISEDPKDLCEAADTYHGGHGSHPLYIYHGRYLGPIVPGNSRWESPRLRDWTPAVDRTFGAQGHRLQVGIPHAPSGAGLGEHVVIRGGFGGFKGGFAHAAGS